MRICFLVYGFGEFAQAESFGTYCQKKGVDTFFLINRPLETIAQKLNYEVYNNREHIYRRIAEYDPGILFLCNSKTAGQLVWRERPKARLTMCLDSNWMITPYKASLYEWKGIHFPNWLDYYVIVFPEKIYRAGLSYFKINSHFKSRIIAPGFIPGAKIRQYSEKEIAEFKKRLNIQGKYIFVYLGRGVTYNYEPLKVICKWAEDHKDITIFHCGEGKIKTKANIIIKEWLKEFEPVIVGAELVIQHEGFGNLTRVISRSTPVLCFWNSTKSKQAELSPFRDLGLIEMESFNLKKSGQINLKSLKSKLDRLLFNREYRNRMMLAQKTIYQPGEANLFKKIQELIRRNKK